MAQIEPTIDDRKLLLTATEAANVLNVGLSTLLELNIKPVEIKDKHGKKKRFRLYRRSDLDRYVEALCTSNTLKENTKPKTGLKKAQSSPPSSGSGVIMSFTEALEKLPAEKRSK